jgi:hypothetical protein
MFRLGTIDIGRFIGLITRGLAEMTRIGTAYGASPLTFLGLAGVGDLFLTCSSSTSRNYTVGYRLGKGEALEDIINTLGSVAEGVTTAKGLKKIIDEMDVSAPIANGVSGGIYRVFFILSRVAKIPRDVSGDRFTRPCTKVWNSFRHCARAELGAGAVGKDIKTGVQELMSRPPSRELDLPRKTGEQAKRLLKKLGIEPIIIE